MNRAAWSLCGLIALGGCQPAPPPGFSGYVEVEAVQVAAPLAGRLVALNVQRGAAVAAGAPLFTLEQENEAAAVREARARVERSEAALRDLQKGQRPDELAALAAAVDASGPRSSARKASCGANASSPRRASPRGPS
jgi:HlyD family secretion protein